MTMRERLTTGGYKAGWSVVKAVPGPVAKSVFGAAGDLAFVRQGKGAKRLEANLRRVLGPHVSDHEVNRLVRQGLRSYSRYWMESFRLPSMSREQIIKRTNTQNEDLFRSELSKGKGMVSALPHMGNWDHAGAWVVATGVPFTTVAERLEPAELFDQFVTYRESLGMEVIALTGGERPPMDVLADRLRAGRLVCLLADRDLTSSGVEVEFFGAKAKMPAGPALLALRTGAPFMPITLSFDDKGKAMTIRFHELIPAPETGDQVKDVAIMTQAMADAFAEAISAHPQDWHMLQRLWLDDLAPRASGARE